MPNIDLLRVAHDAAYVQSLTLDDWAYLEANAEWNNILTEHMDWFTPEVIAAAGVHILGQTSQPAQPRPIHEGPYQIIGKPLPRMHGFGHVTGTGQYSEHMAPAGTLFMKTLLSPHPHAKVRSVNTSKADAFPG